MGLSCSTNDALLFTATMTFSTWTLHPVSRYAAARPHYPPGSNHFPVHRGSGNFLRSCFDDERLWVPRSCCLERLLLISSMSVKFRVYVVRHGETDWNRTRKLQGQSDVSLNETGLKQSMLVGEALKDVPFVSAYSSDLQRAVKVRARPS